MIWRYTDWDTILGLLCRLMKVPASYKYYNYEISVINNAPPGLMSIAFRIVVVFGVMFMCCAEL